jgi:hypothetical protein
MLPINTFMPQDTERKALRKHFQYASRDRDQSTKRRTSLWLSGNLDPYAKVVQQMRRPSSHRYKDHLLADPDWLVSG